MLSKEIKNLVNQLENEHYLTLPQFQEILDAFFTGVVIINAQGLTVAMNSQAASLLKVNKIKSRRMSFHEFLPNSYKEIIHLLRSNKMTASLPVVELENCMLQVTPLAHRNGALLTIFDFRLWNNYFANSGIIDPLTPYLRMIFESSSDGISVVNDKGVLIAVNTATAHLTGMPPSMLLGKTVQSLIDEGYVDTCVSLDVIKKKTTISRLATYYKSGSQLLLTGTPVFDKHQNVKLVIINERDLTHLNKLKEDLRNVKEVNAKIRDELTVLKRVQATESLGFVAESPSMKDLLKVSLKLAGVGAARILITGESGTGKGLLAKFIHENSFRVKNPFVHVNCAALPEQLLEAELFGYDKGAFTGAAPGGKAGLFEVAEEGTVFLDEIGEIPLAIQSKLLTFLDEQTFMRLGGNRSLKANCAIIAATNQNLPQLVKQKKFRADLYYRLNTFSLVIPPLKERSEDLQQIAQNQLSRLNKQYKTNKKFDRLTWQVLLNHNFPGNVRELLALIKKAVVLSDNDNLGPYIFSVTNEEDLLLTTANNIAADDTEIKTLAAQPGAIQIDEREILKQEVDKGKSTREIAKALNISQSTVSRRLREYGLKSVSILRSGRKKSLDS